MDLLIDSHCHLDLLDLSPFDNYLEKLIEHCKKQGVSHILNVSVELDRLANILEPAEQFDTIYASCGLHPNEDPGYIPSVETLVKLADHSKIIAIGETGLDYYRSEEDSDWQAQRFRNHIEAAKITQNPLIIHTRQAKDDTLAIMKEENAQDIGGILHCFTEDWEMAKQAIDLNFYISFSGIVTFKNAKSLQEVAKKIPLDRMLIETDAPYLAPVPFRGKPNYPFYVKQVAEFIAELRGEDFSVIAQQTTHNFFTLFKKVKSYH